MAKECSPFHTCIQACLMLVSIPIYNGLMESGTYVHSWFVKNVPGHVFDFNRPGCLPYAEWVTVGQS